MGSMIIPATLSVIRILLCGVTLAGASWAEPAYLVRPSGASSNRVDVAVLGDGYTVNELGKFAEDVERLLAALFADEPFRSYQTYFNVHRIDVASAESGADHPSSGIFKDTALGAFYECAVIARLSCLDQTLVNDKLVGSLAPDARDDVVVLVNDPEYGGSGGQVAVASLHPSVIEVVLHELGHTLGLLADEYEFGPPACWTYSEPAAANVTIETDRSRIKWAQWISRDTPVPTLFGGDNVAGLYEGAEYCSSGKYRATYDSKMRSLFRPFESVNVEQLTRRIYSYVSPIDEVGVRHRGASPVMRFFARVTAPATHSLRIRWELDGKFLSEGPELRLNTRTLGEGTHELRVTVWDPTSLVRSDPEGLLRDTRSWSIVGAKAR